MTFDKKTSYQLSSWVYLDIFSSLLMLSSMVPWSNICHYLFTDYGLEISDKLYSVFFFLIAHKRVISIDENNISLTVRFSLEFGIFIKTPPQKKQADYKKNQAASPAWLVEILVCVKPCTLLKEAAPRFIDYCCTWWNPTVTGPRVVAGTGIVSSYLRSS